MKQKRWKTRLARPIVVSLITAFVFVVSVAGVPAASAQTPNPGVAVAPSPGAPVTPGVSASIGGEWTGKYVCAQGVTGARLVLSEDGSRALFHFFALPENPAVAEGCFSMSGTFDPSSRSLSLKAGKWIVRPHNYVTANVSGTIDATGQNFSGRVIGAAGCTNVFLSHTVGARSLPNGCARALP